MAKNLYCDNGCKYEGYDKTETDTLLNAKANSSNVYTKSEVYAKSEVYTKTEANNLLNAKVNTSSITSGTANPTGGNDGDIYFQYV